MPLLLHLLPPHLPLLLLRLLLTPPHLPLLLPRLLLTPPHLPLLLPPVPPSKLLLLACEKADPWVGFFVFTPR